MGVLYGAGSTLLHNNLGGQGGRGGDEDSLVPGCEGLAQNDDCSQAMGALPPRTPLFQRARAGLTVRLSHRACAVFGNVTSTVDALRVTGTSGVPVDLWVETTTPYLPAGELNYMKDVGGINSFGEISLRGPGRNGQTSSVGLRFTFKRNDNGAEVTVPWMQFTLFDFDHNMNDGTRGQEVPRRAPTQPPNTRTHSPARPSDPRSWEA